MEAMGTLVGGVAHDLKNILSGIVSYPELLLMQLPEDSPLRGPVQTIQETGTKAAAIVQDLLTMARRGVTIAEVVNLNTLVENYLESPEFKKMLSHHPLVSVRRELNQGPCHILGSPVHLSKTVMNLVANAAEAMPDGGMVRVGTETCTVERAVSGYDEVKPGAYVKLTVTDTGTGIAPEDLNRIFEPFYTKKKMGRSGTGLGMSVVWGTVKDHKGYINAHSTPGQGTTFSLYFPLTHKHPERRDNEDTVATWKGAGQSILVVDDSREQREIAFNILTEMGYVVETVPSGEAALDFLATRSVDLVILDMIMEPGMDGLDTYKKITAIKPGQKTLIASGFSETDRVREAHRLGAGAYVRKPYTIQSIARAVHGVFGQ
jgi:CheY-like chemotaxis protein